MFAVELRFNSRQHAASGERLHFVEGYVASLQKNGSILRNWIVTTCGNSWIVYGVAPAKDAFRKETRGHLVTQCLVDLKNSGIATPVMRFLYRVPETAAACKCASTKAYFLFTTYLNSEPPVRCIDCNGIVPLYRLPRPPVGDYSALLRWQSNYHACDTLQMNCTVGERFAEKQMSDLSSNLTQEGLAACRSIREQTGRPVYYYLYRAAARRGSTELARECPGCGGNWRVREPLWGMFDLRCNRCYLLSGRN